MKAVRWIAHLSSLIGLAALGVALGDFASHPNLPGALGLCVLFAALALAIAQLYRPGGWGSTRPRPARPPEPPEAGPQPEPALWSAGADPVPRRRPPRPSPSADAGWDAREADEARARRRPKRRGRRR